MDFTPVVEGWRALLEGTMTTIVVTLSALTISLVAGLLIGLARLRPSVHLLYWPTTLYVTVIRGTPLLVQLFLLFFGLPQLGVQLPAFFCAVLGLSAYSAAYVSEVVRGAIQSIDRGQMEAARSLGMSYRGAMRDIIVPQALIRMLPPLGNEVVALIKNSALVSLLTIHDLLFEGSAIISVTYRSLEVYLAIAGIYLVLTLTAGHALQRVERALLRRGHLA